MNLDLTQLGLLIPSWADSVELTFFETFANLMLRTSQIYPFYETMTEKIITIYRAVSSQELADIQYSRTFRPNPSRKGYQHFKLFTQKMDDAKQFARRFTQWNHSLYSVIGTSVPEQVVAPYRIIMDFVVVYSIPVGPPLDLINQTKRNVIIIVS